MSLVDRTQESEILSEIEINGDQELGKKVLDMVSVMA